MRTFTVSLSVLFACAALTACGSSTTDTKAKTADATTAAATSTTAGSSAPAAVGLEVTDAWSRAQADLKERNMTGAFGNLRNTTDKPIHIVSGTNSWTAVTELHETVMKDGKKQMQLAPNGFTIPAGATFQLLPGANHIMLMNMTKPLKVGDEVVFTLKTAEGGTVTFKAPAKPFTMGNEPYNKQVSAPKTSK